jgi:hypothetical protein
MEVSMQTNEEVVEYARLCAKQARSTTDRGIALEFWRTAKRLQREAAEHDGGKIPDIGPPPSWMVPHH